MDDCLYFATVIWVDCTKADEDAFGGKTASRTETAVHCIGKFDGVAHLCFVELSGLGSD